LADLWNDQLFYEV